MQTIDNASITDPIIHSLTLLSSEDVNAFVETLVQVQEPTSVGFINQHAYNIIYRDKNTQTYFDALTYRLRDGAGIKLACQYNHCEPGANLNGTDFIPVLLDHLYQSSRDCYTYVFGTEEPWLSKGAAALLQGRPCELLNGFEEDEVYIQRATQYNDPSTLLVIVLAMGMPKQERISQQLMARLTSPAIIICGGAIVDFYAERFSRAPAFFRRWGIEWLYRLCIEPKRLFRRYVIGIPEFIFYMIKNKS